MVRIHLPFAALLTAIGLPALSQPAGPQTSGSPPSATTPNATDAQATIPRLEYRSPFAAYRAERLDQPRPWRDVNDEVGTIGGWRVYAREAQQPATSPPPASVPRSSPASRN